MPIAHGWRCRAGGLRQAKSLCGLCFGTGLILFTLLLIYNEFIIKPSHSNYKTEAVEQDRIVTTALADNKPLLPLDEDELILESDQSALPDLNADQSLAKPNGYDSSRFVMIAPTGRMGNQMFLFASAYGICRHNKRRLIHQGHFYIADVFHLEGYEEVDKHTNRSMIKSVGSAQHCAFYRPLYNLQGWQTQDVFINAYLQSWVYFNDVMADIRRMFTFRPHIVSEVNKYYDSLLRSNNSHSNSYFYSLNIAINNAPESINNENVETTQPVETYVGVHVRRGDMARHEYLKVYGFQTGGPDFVKRAMLYYIQRYSHVTFIVCSDDIKWCRQNIALNQSDIMSLKSDSNNNINNNDIRVNIHFCNETQPDYVHLAVLAACNHSIICGGTYGWWSAFLAGGEAVYYKDYPRRGSKMALGFSPSKSDHYLPGWIPM